MEIGAHSYFSFGYLSGTEWPFGAKFRYSHLLTVVRSIPAGLATSSGFSPLKIRTFLRCGPEQCSDRCWSKRPDRGQGVLQQQGGQTQAKHVGGRRGPRVQHRRQHHGPWGHEKRGLLDYRLGPARLDYTYPTRVSRSQRRRARAPGHQFLRPAVRSPEFR